MKHRRILLGLLVLILLAGLLSVQVFAQVQADADPMAALPAELLTEPAAAQSGYVPGSHTGAALTWEPYVEDLKRSPTTYTTTKDAIAYLQDRAINRRDDVIVDLKISYSKRVTEAYLENLWYTILDGALAHDPSNPVAGDYLAAHIRNVEGKISANVSGSYVLIKYTYSFDYLSTWAQENTLTNNIKKLMPKLGLEGKEDYEQVQAIYDYITENVKYDYEGLENENDIRKFTAYGALVEKSAVCQGYASLFYRLCLEAGIDARLIVGVGTDGTTQIPHAWNIVKVGDYYYNVDATWDAELRQAGYEYAFFLRCERVFAGHIRDTSMDTAAFHRAYPMGGFDFVPGVLESGFCGDAVVYFLLPDYSVTIVGEGPTYDYSDSFSTPWGQYRLMITDVTIEAGVTKIGDYLFAECVNLRSIQIPESVTAIGKYAFDSCEYLKQTHIPATVATFGEGAFKGCAGFTEFTLPKTMDHIPAYLFFGCTNLETLELSGGISQIGDYAFCGCKALSQLPLPEGLQTIGRGAFEGCVSVEQVTLPQSVKTIGVGAFRDCAYLSEIRFPDAITSLPDEILIGCKSLTQVTIPDRVTKIGSSAFRGCASLEEMIIPNTVTKIGGYLFGGCADLKNVVLPDNFTELPDGLFWGCSALEAFTISDKITTLGERVFSECTSLKTMTIPNSVVSIGESLFVGCTALESVKLPARLKSIPTRTFSGCKGLKYFEIPFRVTEVGENAFSSSGLVELTIPGNVEKICDHAFSYCESLEPLIFEDGLTGIGEYAFTYCTSLKNIHFSNTITGIGYMAFWGCSALEQVTLPAAVTYVSASFGLCDNLEKLIVQGDGVILTTGVCSYCPKMNTVIFTGNPPDMEDFNLRGIGDAGDNLVLYYPANNPAWTQEFIDSNSQYYTWKPYYPDCDHVNTWSPNQKEATCTEAGYSGDLHCRDCGQVVQEGQVIPAIGHSDTMVYREPTCTQQGGDVYTCGNCGREYIENSQAMLPHNYEKGVCTVCGGVDENYSEKFALYGSSMTLGNALDMNFFVYQSDIGESTGNYAVITKHYADGRADAVADVPQENWKSLGSSLYYFTFSGVRAKEMADKIDVVIYNAEGEAISEVFTDSVQGYARRMLDNPETIATHRTLYIEMLNYGAAAQAEFGYDTGNLANSVITEEEQAAYGIQDRTYVNQQQKDDAYYGTTLTLENQIVFNIFYHGSYVPEGAYAVAGFTNHYGGQIEERVDAFTTLGNWKYVSFKSLVVSDCSEPITVKLYDADGNLISTVIDSIEGYAARMTEVGPLYDAIMKFADAAYQYFHS